MSLKQCPCGSYAINLHCHGRDKNTLTHLCDVCYWRTLAMQYLQGIQDSVKLLEEVVATSDRESDRRHAIKIARQLNQSTRVTEIQDLTYED